MRQLTDNERAYVEFRKAIIAADQEEKALQASQQLWKEYGEGSWVHDAQVAAEEARAVREAREADRSRRWRSRALAAELGFDPDRLGL